MFVPCCLFPVACCPAPNESDASRLKCNPILENGNIAVIVDLIPGGPFLTSHLHNLTEQFLCQIIQSRPGKQPAGVKIEPTRFLLKDRRIRSDL